MPPNAAVGNTRCERILPAVASQTTQHRHAEMVRNIASRKYFMCAP
nr:MAG TPA: hypothetical protein [Caudoviricetes sp.]